MLALAARFLTAEMHFTPMNKGRVVRELGELAESLRERLQVFREDRPVDFRSDVLVCHVAAGRFSTACRMSGSSLIARMIDESCVSPDACIP